MIEINGKTVFSRHELECSCCGECTLCLGFDDELAQLRAAFGRQMVINSCCRCPDHNKAVNGAVGSYHLTEGGRDREGSLAIDVKRQNADYDLDLIGVARRLNWSIGVYNSFIHLDARTKIFGKPRVFFVGD